MASPLVQSPIIQDAQQIHSSIPDTVVEVASNATETVINLVQTINPESEGSGLLVPLILAILAILGIVYVLFGKKKSGNQNVLALMGQRYSGKTQLFIHLAGGKLFSSVPSIKNNQTTFKSSRKTYQFIDYCGDNISKDEVLNPQNYFQIHTLVHVVDGTDSTKLGDAALFLYRLLVSKAYQKRECNYVIFLNKSDDENFLTKTKIVKRLEDQIQHIKQSRKNSPEESQEEEDFLKTTKERFSLEKSGIKVISGAAKNGEFKELENVLQEVL